MNDHFLCQYIDLATREYNILDLCLTNNDRLVQHLKSEKHKISDHNVVEIVIPKSELALSSDKSLSPKNTDTSLQGFNALNLFDGDYTAISADLQLIDWDTIWSSSSLEDFPQKLSDIVLGICKKHCPKKVLNKSSKFNAHDRSYYSLMRKKEEVKYPFKMHQVE